MKILVIQQKRIGDVLTSTILSNNLKKFYPDAAIDYMCYPNCVDVLLQNPNINEIIVLKQDVRKSYPQLMKFISGIRKRKYDVVIDAYSKLETNLITLFSGAKYKISYDKGYSNLFYNHTLKRLKNGTKSELGLAIDNRLMLLKPLIKEPITDYKPKVFLTEAEIEEAKKLLARFGIQEETKPLVMFGILGSEWYKTYPLDKMAKIIDFTVEQLNADIIFNYIPSQKEDALKIYNFCKTETQKNIHFDLYSEGLRPFLALLSQCSMLIGNEGGSVNMAKALSVPTFSLFSPSVDKETWQIFENEKENLSIHLKDLKPEIYEQHDEKYIKEHTFKYFDEYPLELILEKLKQYFRDLGFLKS
ncbi:glycosyltransferase family 9 protein [Flavobacterium sp. GT3R68]|uniref:glycosyltransferase family 9 protein n=1 Tax=Flavobacterium sp. GT3R68 TaxID=2594437 RepID=UPI000F892780|nr:glycosyltransferase family 9 protein [Flavobacterium sp. GT3R68]RTY92386.1 lipopolysaccharide heptosyltransferase family protein [Flavobacterium sp. GSN2]TRW92302.1 glycosyltransferase family 9 protein [Flavobacterium sp. GT3R68]